jgi:hypothetical protein
LIVRNRPNVITLPTEWPFSGSPVVFFGWKVAHAAFGVPASGAPFTGFLIGCIPEITTSQSTPANGILSPGFRTVCFAFA